MLKSYPVISLPLKNGFSDMTKTHQNSEIPLSYDDSVDIYSLLVMVWRQKIVIIIMMILGVIGAYILLSITPPRYTAKANILVAFDENSLSPEYILSIKKPSSFFDIGSVLTELEILKSRKLASRVVGRLNLVSDFKDKEQTTAHGFRQVSVDGTYLKTLPPEAIDPDVSKAVTYFLKNLKVVSIPGTLAVKISYTSPIPQKAAMVVNTLIDEYVRHKIEQKTNKQERIADWLDMRLTKLRSNLYKIETKIENYKKEYDLVPDRTNEVAMAREKTNLGAQYSTTKEQLNTLQSQLKLLSNDSLEDVLGAMNSKFLNTASVRQLQSDKFKQESKLRDLSKKYGPKHPSIISKTAELKDIDINIQNEFKKSKAILRSEIKTTQNLLKELEEGLETKQKMEQPEGGVLVQLQSMEREAEASRMVLKTFLENYNRSLGKSELQDSDVEIISHANIPFDPSYPNKILVFALSIVCSLMMGLFMAIILEKGRRQPTENT